MISAGMVVVVPPELETGFRLAGVETVGVEHDDTVRSLSELRGSGEHALIAIYEPLLSAMSPSERESIEASLEPVVVLLPAGLEEHDEARHRARISEMLSRAVGYHITFGEGNAP